MVGIALALDRAQKHRDMYISALQKLGDELVKSLISYIPDISYKLDTKRLKVKLYSEERSWSKISPLGHVYTETLLVALADALPELMKHVESEDDIYISPEEFEVISAQVALTLNGNGDYGNGGD